MIWILLLIFVTSCSSQDYLVEWTTRMEELNKWSMISEKFRNPRPLEVGTAFFNVTFTDEPQHQTVHNLRPQDIDVIGAMGDSVTAATGAGADYLPGIAIQFRGVSWTAGGDESLEKSMTITNLLRKFNPTVKGYSIGNGLGFNVRPEDWFNVAIPGARAHDMTDQAYDLVDKMKNDTRTDFENSWKVISLWIGGNDLCALDRDPVGSTAEVYVAEIEKALDVLHKNIPRALVQVIQILEIYLLPELQKSPDAPPLCSLTQSVACGYISEADVETEQVIKEINWQYQEQLAALIDSGKYDTNDDFTVVLQPFFQDTILPVTPDGYADVSYFAPDCFHFSSKGHAMGAMNLWNNMFEPYGSKTTKWSIRNFTCPTEEHPYIYTRKNSPPAPLPLQIKREAKADAPAPTECSATCTRVADWAVAVICTLAGMCAFLVFCMIMLVGKK